MLSQKYDLYYFKVDGILDEYTRRGAQNGYPVCKKIVAMDAEQTWMRDPLLQCREELDFYAQVFEYVSADLKRVAAQRSVITEGAAYVPKLMRWAGVLGSRYIAITPAGEFQIFHYSKREFVPYILEGCRSKDQAFRNWCFFRRRANRQYNIYLPSVSSNFTIKFQRTQRVTINLQR